ncbi:MAG: hypothetical protein QOH52_2355 [Pseudonocardiales bacterium]|jgi:hypothetical protein|nr:hypothetical protein [Jatrophihabitans sp.]MDT4904339.1 hypothetical protein [Pseudonocardiales bacterium]
MILDGPESSKFCPDRRQDSPVSDFTPKVRSRDGSAFLLREVGARGQFRDAPT